MANAHQEKEYLGRYRFPYLLYNTNDQTQICNLVFALLEVGVDENRQTVRRFVPGTMIDFKLAPFKGRLQIVQSSHPFQFEGLPGSFIKYAVVV